jgi:hypothetical protein
VIAKKGENMTQIKLSENAKKRFANSSIPQEIPYIQFVANKRTESKLDEIEKQLNIVLQYIASQKK